MPNNRVSVMFDVNIPKSNRLTQRDQPWTFVDDDFTQKQVEPVTSLEAAKAALKS